MPPGHVAALAGTRRAAGRARDRRGLPAARAHRDVGRHGGAAQPVAGPARPDQRGAHDGGALAGGAGGRTAHPRRGQRRRPAGGLGRRARPATCTGWVPACVGSTMPSAARPARAASSSRRTGLVVRGCGFARPDPEATLVVDAGRRRRAASGPTGGPPGAALAARSVQPGQRLDGGRRRRGVRRRRRRGAGRHGGGARRWRVASRSAPSATCGPG